ncbi:MAB_1171c family putative transporter [Streptomyces sp. NPDC020965]|uniref:MAB_1171c family putative transporter n=1 Tax=Streptomyces sp. NPDC020965 TaxID=3365105 RepID=UPI0037AFFA51
MRNSDYYLPAVALGIAFVAKLPALKRGWRDPLVRSVHFLLFTAGVCFFFAAPPTISAVNRITGVSNLSGPLVYCIMCAFSCACLVLIVNWRGGARERVRRGVRRWILAYGAAIVALPVLFVLGDAPVERLRDLDTYYANTPFIREMIITYLAAHIVSALVTTTMCLRWARAVGQWLRIGLVVLVFGFVFNLLFGVSKLTAVVARWTGRDWDALSTTVAPPLAAAGGLVTTVGFLLPLVGPRLSDLGRAWLTYARLGTLWRRLRVLPREDAPLPMIPWWAAPGLRLTVRETVIHDELLRLQPYLDDRVRRRAYDASIVAHAPREHARSVSVAAMVLVAVAARLGGDAPGDEESSRAGAEALTAALSPGRERLVRLSRTLRSPFLTDAVRSETRAGRGTGGVGDRRGGGPSAAQDGQGAAYERGAARGTDTAHGRDTARDTRQGDGAAHPTRPRVPAEPAQAARSDRVVEPGATRPATPAGAAATRGGTSANRARVRSTAGDPENAVEHTADRGGETPGAGNTLGRAARSTPDPGGTEHPDGIERPDRPNRPHSTASTDRTEHTESTESTGHSENAETPTR